MIYTDSTKRAMKLCFEAHKYQVDKSGLPYMDYVMKSKANPIARKVKLAGLRHNSDRTRLDYIDARAEQRIRKYQAVIRLLEENQEGAYV